MKNRSKNKLHHIAAGIFLLGLIANVSLSLTDPFIFVDTDVLSQVSGSSGSGSSSSSSSGNWYDGRYDEEKTIHRCVIIWNFGIYQTKSDGFQWKCVDGTEYFCNDGCWEASDGPA